jgi:hypothetical protein
MHFAVVIPVVEFAAELCLQDLVRVWDSDW